MDISGSSLENPTAHGLARLLVVPSGAFAPHIAGHPGPETEQLQQVVAGADEQPFPVHLRQTPQQELPEAPALLDLAEHRFNRLHPKAQRSRPRFVRSLRRIRSLTDSPLGMRPRCAGSNTLPWRVFSGAMNGFAPSA